MDTDCQLVRAHAFASALLSAGTGQCVGSCLVATLELDVYVSNLAVGVSENVRVRV